MNKSVLIPWEKYQRLTAKEPKPSQKPQKLVAKETQPPEKPLNKVKGPPGIPDRKKKWMKL
jgi:hypothetical protein